MSEIAQGEQYEDSFQKMSRLRKEAAVALQELRTAVSVKDRDMDTADQGYADIQLVKGVLDGLDKEEGSLNEEIEVLKGKYKTEAEKGESADGDLLDSYMTSILALQDRVLKLRESNISLCNQIDTLYEEHAALSGDADGSIAVVGMLFKKYAGICKQLRDLN